MYWSLMRPLCDPWLIYTDVEGVMENSGKLPLWAPVDGRRGEGCVRILTIVGCLSSFSV